MRLTYSKYHAIIVPLTVFAASTLDERIRNTVVALASENFMGVVFLLIGVYFLLISVYFGTKTRRLDRAEKRYVAGTLLGVQLYASFVIGGDALYHGSALSIVFGSIMIGSVFYNLFLWRYRGIDDESFDERSLSTGRYLSFIVPIGMGAAVLLGGIEGMIAVASGFLIADILTHFPLRS